MARITINGTILQVVNGVPSASAVAIPDVVTTNAAAITAALANGTISGDGTALGLVTAIQTSNNLALQNVSVSIDRAVVLTKDQLRAAFNEIINAAIAGGIVT